MPHPGPRPSNGLKQEVHLSQALLLLAWYLHVHCHDRVTETGKGILKWGSGEMTKASCALPSSGSKWLLHCQETVFENFFGGLTGNSSIPNESEPYRWSPFCASMHTHMHTHAHSMRLHRKLVF